MNNEKLILDFLNNETIGTMRKNFRKNLIVLLRYYIDKNNKEILVRDLKNNFKKEPWFMAGVLFQKEHEEFIKKNVFQYKNINKPNFCISFLIDLDTCNSIVSKFNDVVELNNFSLTEPTHENIEKAISLLKETKNCKNGDFEVDQISFNDNLYPAKCVGQIAYALSNDVINDYLHPYVLTAYGIRDKVFKTLNIEYKPKGKNGNMNTIKIKVGEFLQEHVQNIIDMCSNNIDEFIKLQNLEYTKETFGSRTNYPFFDKLSNISNDNNQKRYYKKDYTINNDTYRLCSQFGGKNIIDGKTVSEYQGKKLYDYFNTNDLVLDKFKDKEIIFIVGNDDTTIDAEESNATPQIENAKQPLNHILYGPPGTGKTYNTINKALDIIFEIEDKEDTVYYDFDFDFEQKEISYNNALRIEDTTIKRKVLKNIFEHYVKAGQIEFVTFHQSYGYEEFIEGIKAIPVGEEGNETGQEMIYKVVNGVFKSLVKEGTSKDEIQDNNLTNYDSSTIWKMSLGDSQNGEDKEYFEEAVNTDTIIMGYGGFIDYSKCHDKRSIEQLNTKDTSASMIHRFKNELKNDDILIISDGNRKFKAIVQVVGDYFYDENSDFKHKRKIKWLKKFTTSRSYNEISDRYFTQVTLNRPQGVNKEDLLDYLSETTTIDNSKKNYILIIDEINRGNISKIFGELITLIEDSKRAGANESIEITLPYSGEPFSVPKNLYILGTMNTADRSIALMDTALRRRFEFTEMMPNLKVLKQIDDCKGINIRSLLKSINKRIEYLYDRDHTIGHAYFMSLNEQIKDENDLLRDKTDDEKIIELKGIFQNKIIPLLQEYFYDDWEKIRLVLGDNQKDDEALQFIKIKQGYNVKDLFGDKGLDSFDIDDESNVYEINKKAFNNPKSYIKVYAK